MVAPTYRFALAWPNVARRTMANHPHVRNVRRNIAPRRACYVTAVRKFLAGTSHRSARQTSVKRVRMPMTVATPKVTLTSGIGAVLTRNRYAVPAMVHASTMSAKPAINSEKPKICGTSASSSPWLNGDRHDRSDVLNSRHGHESSQGPRADTGVVGCHECVAPDWWVLPSSSVGEESLSPNHPDTSSRF